MHPNRLRGRIEKLVAWFDYLDEAYTALLSRAEETSSKAGFADPILRRYRCAYCASDHPCRNDACKNGWVTVEERDGYETDLPKTTTGIVLDESEGARRSREIARLTASIEAISRDVRIRHGVEAMEDPMMRAVRVVQRRPDEVKKIQRGLDVVASRWPALYDRLPHDEAALAALALVIPGRLDPPR